MQAQKNSLDPQTPRDEQSSQLMERTRCPGAGGLQEAKKETRNSPAFVVSMS